MLTQELIQELRKPFPANEHKFFGGYPYVDEEAVTDRLDNVDPNWQFEQLEVKRTDIECIVIARLTIHDVSRDGIGMSKLTIKKRDGTTIPAQEPEKGAITDALRRCARLFGIGRYLLLIPKDDDGKSTVTNVKLLGEWLGQSVGNTTQKAPPVAQKPAQQTPQAQSTLSIRNGDLVEDFPPNAQSTAEPLELVDNGVYRVNSFTMNMSKGRVQKPYMVFAIGNSAAFSYTREPFRVAGYNVDGWTKVSNYELPTAADITVEKDHNGYFIVKSVKMIDLFADSKTA